MLTDNVHVAYKNITAGEQYLFYTSDILRIRADTVAGAESWNGTAYIHWAHIIVLVVDYFCLRYPWWRTTEIGGHFGWDVCFYRTKRTYFYALYLMMLVVIWLMRSI